MQKYNEFSYSYFVFQDGSEDVSNLTKGTRVFNPFQLFIPAMCDMVGKLNEIITENFKITITNSKQIAKQRSSLKHFLSLMF